MSRHPLRAAVKHHVSAFNVSQQSLLNRIDCDADSEALATTYVIKHHATDLLEMLGLS